jgi:ATP-dependent DNA helicase
MYHGTPAERAELRRTVMRERSDPDGNGESASSQKAGSKTKTKTKTGTRKSTSTPRKNSGRGQKVEAKPPLNVRRSGRKRYSRKLDYEDEDEDEDERQEEDEDEDEEGDDEYKDEDVPDADADAELDPDIPMADGTSAPPTVPPSFEEDDTEPEISTFPVVITTYEMIIKDRIHLALYNWGYIVVDEGHRLKNLDCKLMQEIKKYPSAGRMILTGTPLHVSFLPVPFCIFCSC